MKLRKVQKHSYLFCVLIAGETEVGSLGFCFLGGAILAAEQCRGGCAGGAGAGHARLGRKRRAGGQPGAAVAGVAFRSRSCRFSSLGKLQVTNPPGACLGAASRGCGVLCGWGAAVNPPPCCWGFCPCLDVRKAVFTSRLSLHGHSLQGSLV